MDHRVRSIKVENQEIDFSWMFAFKELKVKVSYLYKLKLDKKIISKVLSVDSGIVRSWA